MWICNQGTFLYVKNNINETKSQITSEGGMPEVKQRVTMSVVDMELFQINKKNAKTLGEG